MPSLPILHSSDVPGSIPRASSRCQSMEVLEHGGKRRGPAVKMVESNEPCVRAAASLFVADDVTPKAGADASRNPEAGVYETNAPRGGEAASSVSATHCAEFSAARSTGWLPGARGGFPGARGSPAGWPGCLGRESGSQSAARLAVLVPQVAEMDPAHSLDASGGQWPQNEGGGVPAFATSSRATAPPHNGPAWAGGHN